MKKKVITIICCVFLLSFVARAQEIDLKTAKKIAKVNASALKKAGVNKVMFMEFFGTFVTSKETAPSTMSMRYSSGPVYKRTQTVELSEDYYETLTNEIYELVRQVFIDNGIEVLDKSTLLENQDYIALGLKEEKERREYTGGVAKQSVTSETIVRSVTGMGMWSETLRIGAVSKIKQMIPKIAHDNNCQAAVAVKFKIGIGKKGAPTLTFLNSTVDVEIDSYGKGKNETFFFKKGGIALFTSNKELVTDIEIVSESGDIDMEKYHNGILDLVENMTNSFSLQLKDQLN